MTIQTTTPPALNTTQLSYDCIDAKPIDYEYGSDNWAENTENGMGWRVCSGTIVPADLDTVIHDGDRVIEFLDTTDYEISVASGEDCESFLPSDDEWNELVEKFGIDADDLRDEIDGENYDRWAPAMNYAYPLCGAPPEDWKTKVSNCTCVEIDGEHYLALTGGGMDMSWEICASYMRLGYYPPVHFAARLPRMAGRGKSNFDKWLIDGCRKSIIAMRDRMQWAIDNLDDIAWNEK